MVQTDLSTLRMGGGDGPQNRPTITITDIIIACANARRAAVFADIGGVNLGFVILNCRLLDARLIKGAAPSDTAKN